MFYRNGLIKVNQLKTFSVLVAPTPKGLALASALACEKKKNLTDKLWGLSLCLWLSVYLSVYISVYISVPLSKTVYLSVSLSVYLSVSVWIRSGGFDYD
jgi:hypothetical protein